MNKYKQLLENSSLVDVMRQNQRNEIPSHIKDTILKLGYDLEDVTVTPDSVSIWDNFFSKKELQILLKNKSFVSLQADDKKASIVNIKFKNR